MQGARGLVLSFLAAACLTGAHAVADEGLWTFDNFPTERVRAEHGFAPDQAFLDHLRLSSVRLPGCSAGLVSARGLVQTNHHCVSDCITDLSAPGQDVAMTPVLAKTEADERQCPGLAAEVVTRITNVTSVILSAATGLEGEAAAVARREAIARLESDCTGDDEDRFCEVVPLYEDGVFSLHEYRVYSDVRLVLAPETAAGSFGGDPDNFNFPRFAFDVAFLRLYENGAPAATPDHLEWRSTPLAAGETVFVSGNPGETGRRWTTSSVGFLSDAYYPWMFATESELRGRLIAFSALGPEEARSAAALLGEIENSFKGLWNERSALAGAGFVAKLHANEEALRKAVAADPDTAPLAAGAWDAIAAADARHATFFLRHLILELEAGGASALFAYAKDILRFADERGKPDEKRLEGYTDADREDLERSLTAPREFSPALERLVLGFWLSKAREFLSADDPAVRTLLGKESPEGLADRLVRETRLADPAERRRLFEGGKAAVDASSDPMILLARSIDAQARALHEQRQALRDIKTAERKRIAAARFRLYGDTEYPDATGTLRISVGRVKGWTEPDGRVVEPFTTFAGLFDRATGSEPFKLAPLWEAARGKLSPGTVFDVATDNDTVGGNSGSPVVDREGRIVGAMFDGNRHSLGGFFLYDPSLNRSVVIASTAIEEGLSKVYGLDRIVSELTGR